MNRILLALLLASSILACSESDRSNYYAADDLQIERGSSLQGNWSDEANAEALSLPRTAEPEAPQNAPRKLIRNGSMQCRVVSLDSAKVRLLSLLKDHEGYVSSERASTNYRAEENYTLRVPEDKFDTFLSGVNGIADKVISRNISVVDVTEQYVDIAARLSTKRALHARYTQLLAKAKNVKEVIEVERELANVLADIESSEARLKSLGDRSSYATLELTLFTEIEPTAQANFFSSLGESFVSGWSGVKMAILIGATLWPLALFGLLLFFGIRWAIKRRKAQEISA